MGCFNTTGFLSRLPIFCGDRVVCFLGKININHDVYGFTPYHVFSLVSPICLPIYGSYNDYGSIELIDDTPVKKLLEKLSGVNCELLFNAVRDCGYSPIKYELEHWGYIDGEMPEDDWDRKHVESILPILKLYNIESIPVILFEHEDFYNKLTDGPADITFWGQKKPKFDLFYEGLDKFQEIVKEYDIDVKRGPILYGDEERFGLSDIFWAIYDKYAKNEEQPSEEVMNKIKEKQQQIVTSLIYRGEQPDAFQIINNLEVNDFIKLVKDCKDEVKKVFNLYYTLNSMPMYIGLSKTAGEQNYSREDINKFFDLLDEQRQKFNERCKEWDDDYDDEDEDV